jgi:ABC-2 type transport system permease protein
MMEPVIRTFAFVRKELVDVVRQPMLLLALIVGPFLILLAFGAGLRETDPPLQTVLVASEESEVREQVEAYARDESQGERLVIEGVTGDEAAALVQLRAEELDLVIVFPDVVSEDVEENEQAIIRVFHNQIDPVEGQAIRLFTRAAVDELNSRLLSDVIAQFQEEVRTFREREATDEVGDTDPERFLGLEPDIVVNPFRGETQMVTGQTVQLTDFYAPAVVVVLLQHLAITLLGLSVVRERALGVTELFRVSPMRTGEYLAGKFLAYLLLGGVVAAALLALLVFGLNTPMAGDWWHLVATLALLLFTSTAVGLVLSLLANSDSQAVQYAMLVLLATIFRSGFLLSVERFVPLAQWLPWLLPATYGIELVRDIMLRGVSIDPVVLGGLAVYGLVFAIAGAPLAHRKLNSPGI